MNFFIESLAVPMAVIGAGLAQVPTVQESGAGTLASAIGALAAGIIALTFTLDKLGKLPGGGSFNQKHAEQLEKIENLLSYRNPTTSRERILEIVDEQRRAAEQIHRIELAILDIHRYLNLKEDKHAPY